MNVDTEHGFAFPACDGSPEITISELTECLIHRHAIPFRVAQGILNKELTSEKEKCDSGPRVMESSRLPMVHNNQRQLD